MALGLRELLIVVLRVGTGVLLIYQKMSDCGKEPVTEQLRLMGSPGMIERGACDKNGPDGIAKNGRISLGIKIILLFTYNTENLCLADGIKVRELVADFTSVDTA